MINLLKKAKKLLKSNKRLINPTYINNKYNYIKNLVIKNKTKTCISFITNFSNLFIWISLLISIIIFINIKYFSITNFLSLNKKID